ncbi:MAG TPA: NUDIX domain-containing protein [Thermomicrobiales bacterium]|nr:NUDIX domain-containing protein [Thermomicrobiales bacterium]
MNTVPFVGDQVLVVQLDNGQVEMPGGTLEPGEHYEEAIARELVEEAGAEPRSFSPIGYWRCFSTAPSPYRPHVPHPTFARLVGISDVLIVGPPSNPEGGERVVSVDALSVPEAAERFIAGGRPDIAELYRLASAIRRMHATEAL